jgi:hypothetical protein
MRLEALTTFLELGEWREPAMGSIALPSMLGVFRHLPFVPSGFFLAAHLSLPRPRAMMIQVLLFWGDELQWELIPEAFDFPSRHATLIYSIPPSIRLARGTWTVQLLMDNTLVAETMVHFGQVGDSENG